MLTKDDLHDNTVDNCQLRKLAKVLADARGRALSLGRCRRESANFDVLTNFFDGSIILFSRDDVIWIVKYRVTGHRGEGGDSIREQGICGETSECGRRIMVYR